LWWLNHLPGLGTAFSLSMMSSTKEIYGVPKSGWKSPEWNWGYASGSGHDCAAICRRQFATRKSRATFVEGLFNAPLAVNPKAREPQNFEEVKLVLALAWQGGRRDGSDGGRGGYGQVLAALADADRYENGNEDECSRRLIQDMQDRFQLLNPSEEDLTAMQTLFDELEPDVDAVQRRCSALVLSAMGFVENGL
jgi:hypothetical protein